MTTQSNLLGNANKNLVYYEIVLVDKALGEDGKWLEGDSVGYGLRNKQTNIIEHTSVMLPGVLWQATHFESTLKSLLADEDEVPGGDAGADVLPFGTH